MLGDSEVAATVPASDLDRAKKFYTEVLGLKQLQEGPGGVVLGGNSGKVFVYETEFAGTNKATTASWTVDDVDAVAKDLREKSVTLEHYDMPNVTRQGDVHVMGDLRAIWFKDTEGNILAVTNSMG